MVFLYNNPEDIDVTLEHVVGFDAGDQMNGLAAVNIDNPSFGILDDQNIFRIDGMALLCQNVCCYSYI